MKENEGEERREEGREVEEEKVEREGRENCFPHLFPQHALASLANKQVLGSGVERRKWRQSQNIFLKLKWVDWNWAQ